jgi:hypothetical protein
VPKGFSTAEICFPKALREQAKQEGGDKVNERI